MMDNHIVSVRNAIIIYYHGGRQNIEIREIILEKIKQLKLTRQHPLTCRTFRDHQHQFSRFNPTIFYNYPFLDLIRKFYIFQMF